MSEDGILIVEAEVAKDWRSEFCAAKSLATRLQETWEALRETKVTQRVVWVLGSETIKHQVGAILTRALTTGRTLCVDILFDKAHGEERAIAKKWAKFLASKGAQLELKGISSSKEVWSIIHEKKTKCVGSIKVSGRELNGLQIEGSCLQSVFQRGFEAEQPAPRMVVLGVLEEKQVLEKRLHLMSQKDALTLAPLDGDVYEDTREVLQRMKSISKESKLVWLVEFPQTRRLGFGIYRDDTRVEGKPEGLLDVHLLRPWYQQASFSSLMFGDLLPFPPSRSVVLHPACDESFGQLKQVDWKCLQVPATLPSLCTRWSGN